MDTEDSIPDEGPATLGDALREALSRSEAEPTEIEDTEGTPDEEPSEVVVEVREEGTDEAEADEVHSESLVAPEDWSADDKAVFDSLDEAGKQFLLRRHKELEGESTKRFQEASELRKRYEPLDQILQPYEVELQRSGMTVAQGVQQLIAAHEFIKRDPRTAIQQLAKAHRIEVSFDDDLEDDLTDPEVKALKSKLEALEGQLRSRESQPDPSLQQQITAFADARTDSGELLYPHFDQVRPAMAALLNSGRAQTLEDAYEKAVWAEPELREELLKAERDKAAQEAEEARKQKVAAAKKQPPSAKSKKRVQEASPKSLRDELASQLQEAS